MIRWTYDEIDHEVVMVDLSFKSDGKAFWFTLQDRGIVACRLSLSHSTQIPFPFVQRMPSFYHASRATRIEKQHPSRSICKSRSSHCPLPTQCSAWLVWRECRRIVETRSCLLLKDGEGDTKHAQLAACRHAPERGSTCYLFPSFSPMPSKFPTCPNLRSSVIQRFFLSKTSGRS